MNVSKIAKDGLLYTQTGTPYYASPEVWKDKPYDSKSDIWSLGCVIYEMTTLKPPFRAEDMDGLYKKVTKGSYSKIGDNYSKQLAVVIKSMLQVNPANRPDATQLISNLRGKAEELDIEIDLEVPANQQLLQTIRAHKNLHYLTDRLPKSNYQNGHEYEKVPKLSQSSKAKNPTFGKYNERSVGINLPKLDGIIVKNSAYKNSLEIEAAKKPYQIDISNMLKIEGKGSQPSHLRNEYQYEPKKAHDRDIKAELRKIYNLKPSPKKPNRRVIELPRIK